MNRCLIYNPNTDYPTHRFTAMFRSLLARLALRSSSTFHRTNEYEFDHYTDATERVKQLKRERRHDEVEELLLWCIEYAEAETASNGWESPPPGYYRHLAIVYRKDDRNDDEVAILERYVSNGGDKEGMLDRLERARELATG